MPAEDARDGRRFDSIAQRGRGGVRIDIVDAAGVHLRVVDRQLHRLHLPFRVRARQPAGIRRCRGTEQFGVNSTPTFFINGKKMTTGPSIEEFDTAFGAILKS